MSFFQMIKESSEGSIDTHTHHTHKRIPVHVPPHINTTMSIKEMQYLDPPPSPIPTTTEDDDCYGSGGGDVQNEFKYEYERNDLGQSTIEQSDGDEDDDEDKLLDDMDVQGISLLSEIFPDASREELEELHFQRVETVTKLNASTEKEGGHQGIVRDEDESSNDQLDTNLSTEEVKNNLGHDFNNGGDDSIVKTNDTSSTNSSESNTLNSIGGSYSYELGPNSKLSSMSSPLSSPLGRRILQQCQNPMNERYNALKNCLSDDFLRIPSQQPVIQHSYNGSKDCSKKDQNSTEIINWEAISRLEKNVTIASFGNAYPGSRHNYSIKTVVLHRDMYVGLGLRLREWKGCIYVDALLCQNGNEVTSMEKYQKELSKFTNSKKIDTSSLGPAFNAGIKPGDRILGVNGKSFSGGSKTDMKQRIQNWKSIPSKNLLSEAVRIITEASADPIAVHVMRRKGEGKYENEIKSPFHVDLKTSEKVDPLNKTTDNDKWIFMQDQSNYPKPVHPLTLCLSKSGIVKTGNVLKASKALNLYTERALMWKSNDYLRGLIYEKGSNEKNRRRDVSIAFGEKPTPNTETKHSNLDLSIVRQGLCVHIVNAFVDQSCLAFTIWVYDVESQRDWYAPIRYFQDFRDLRLAISRLYKNVEKIPFPNPRWFHEPEASSSQSFQEARCQELELFLRELCTLIYKNELKNSSISEIALYIQTFLGCDAHIDPLVSDVMDEHTTEVKQSETERNLKCAVQLHTFRIFLLPALNTLVTNFISGVKKRVLLFDQKKTVSKTSDSTEKETILSELSKIRHFYSSLTELITDGCHSDFKLMSKYYRSNNSSVTDTVKIIQDSVREQVEIHAYVPLRSLLSKLLVFGWRHDDKEFYFKQQALQEKDQSFFKIKSHQQSPSNWQSVISILNKDVGQSTLPCVKLQAIVNAGKEIGRLSSVEFPNANPLGADDFLPIFIYCVNRAEIERPYALSILLRNLCNEDRLLGEIGYYLSSFEATIAYIHELDLSSMNQ